MERQRLSAECHRQPPSRATINQWGFQASGPVEIPKLLTKNANTRCSIWRRDENYLELFPQPIRVGLPTAEMRTGDFSRLKNATGDLIRIYDPLNAPHDAGGNPGAIAVPGQCGPPVEDRPGSGGGDEVLSGSERCQVCPINDMPPVTSACRSSPTISISGTGTAASTRNSAILVFNCLLNTIDRYAHFLK